MYTELAVVLTAFAILALIMLVVFVVAVIRTFQEKPATAPKHRKPTPVEVAAFDNYVIARMEYEERKNQNIDAVLNTDNPL